MLEKVAMAVSAETSTLDHPTELRADRDLVVLLGRALRQLGEAGRPIAASRLAGQAWWATRDQGDERGAARINGVMHYLATLPPESEPDTETDPDS